MSSMSARECEATLKALHSLKQGWDGYHAAPINKEVLKSIEQYLKDHIAPLPSAIVPMSGGRVQLEWHNGPRSFELEFESPDWIHYLLWGPQVRENRLLLKVSKPKINQMIEETMEDGR